jgi:hypothetical protein
MTEHNVRRARRRYNLPGDLGAARTASRFARACGADATSRQRSHRLAIEQPEGLAARRGNALSARCAATIASFAIDQAHWRRRHTARAIVLSASIESCELLFGLEDVYAAARRRSMHRMLAVRAGL